MNIFQQKPGSARAFEATGILLCGGSGSRFDPSGEKDKLMQLLPSGQPVAAESARRLLAAAGRVVAVVRPGKPALATLLSSVGCEVCVAEDASLGMSATLRRGLQAATNADGWLLALADMPYVAEQTYRALLDALAHGHDIVVPEYDGKRGNPVGFSRRHLPALLALSGDAGARSLLQRPEVHRVAVDDPGIRRDIDTPADLA